MVVFANYVPKVDDSISLRFTTNLIAQDKDVLAFHGVKGMTGALTFLPDRFDGDVPEVQTDELDRKTKSERLRGVLYVQLHQKLGKKPSEEEWRKYYNKSMEALIERIKTTLE